MDHKPIEIMGAYAGLLSELASPDPLDFMPLARRRAYGIYVMGDEMAPRFEPGYLVLVNPSRAIRRGDNVLVQIRNRDEIEKPNIHLAIYDSRTVEELVARQLKGERTLRWPLADVIAVHRIVGVAEL